MAVKQSVFSTTLVTSDCLSMCFLWWKQSEMCHEIILHNSILVIEDQARL